MEKKYILNIIINGIHIPFASSSIKDLDLITTGFDDKEELWDLVKKRYIQKSFINNVNDNVQADFDITYVVNNSVRAIDVLYSEDYKFLSMKPQNLKNQFLLCSHDREFIQSFISEYANYATPNSAAKRLIDEILHKIAYQSDYSKQLNEYLNILLHGYSSIEDINYKGCRDIYLADKKYRMQNNLLVEDENEYMRRAFNEKHIEIRKDLLDTFIKLNYGDLMKPPIFKILSTGENNEYSPESRREKK